MSIADFRWPRRRPVIDEQEPRTFKLPPDMEQALEHAMDDYSGVKHVRTAQVISNEIAHLRSELSAARMLVARGEAKEAELVAELQSRIDEETAAHKAECEAKLAELEKLRPSTGEPSEGNQT
jgi:hypothetical protein